MDGNLPLRIIQDGDHQVVHLPAGVTIPEGATLREEGGGRYVIEPKMGNIADLLAVLRSLEPIDEDMGQIEDFPARPVNL